MKTDSLEERGYNPEIT